MTNALTATLRTNRGTVVVRLFPDHAPKTVRNFVELAEGGREWTDPTTRRTGAAKLYDGTIFHRVIPRFMIQGGDPLGTGTGGPGYKFGDEIHPDLRFDRPDWYRPQFARAVRRERYEDQAGGHRGTCRCAAGQVRGRDGGHPHPARGREDHHDRRPGPG